MDSSRRGFLGLLGALGLGAREVAKPAPVEVAKPAPAPAAPLTGLGDCKIREFRAPQGTYCVTITLPAGRFYPGKAFAVEDPGGRK